MGGAVGRLLGLTLAGLLLLGGGGCKHRRQAHKHRPGHETAHTATAREPAQRETAGSLPPSPTPPEAEARPPGAAAALRGPCWQIAGWGLSRAEAEQDAQQRAAQQVTAYLRQQQPGFPGVVSAAQVRDQLQSGPARREPARDQDVAGGALAPAQCWVISVELTPERLTRVRQQSERAWQEQLRAQRRTIACQRLLAASPPLAGILVLLFALWLVLRRAPTARN
jgi:hypothetical protein